MMHPAGKVVLVVDDEVFARLFAAQIFLDEGYTVLEAEDAEDGLRVLDCNDDVALLFTDISMPGGMDGLELMEQVRRAHPAMAMIATSGRVDPGSSRLPGGSCFLPKPYTAHALMEAMRKAARGHCGSVGVV